MSDIKEATVLRQTLRDLRGQILITDSQPNRLSLPDLKSHLYSGDVGGEVYIDFGPNPQFVLNLIGTQLRLEEFGSMNLGPDARLQGGNRRHACDCRLPARRTPSVSRAPRSPTAAG